MQLLWLLLPLLPLAYSNPANNTEDLLWGAYRPNLYFGLRPRLPQSLMTGLIWFGTQNFQSIGSKWPAPTSVADKLNSLLEARHACDQSDGLDSYTWTHFDARQGGVQIIQDSQNNVKITTELLKVPGGSHGGSWAARIKGEPIDPRTRPDSPYSRHSLMYPSSVSI
jgi:mannosyl-oligosaccharide glucosidase